MPSSVPGSSAFAPPSGGSGSGATGGGSPSLPSGIKPAIWQTAQFYIQQGIDPSTAIAMASMQQPSSTGSAIAAGVGGAGAAANEVLEASFSQS